MTDTMSRIIDLQKKIKDAGYINFSHENGWEAAFCALIMTLEPRTKIYRVLEALPYKKQRLDENDFINLMANLGYASATMSHKMAIDNRIIPYAFIDKKGHIGVVTYGRDKLYGIYYNTGYAETNETPQCMIEDLWIFKKEDLGNQYMNRMLRETLKITWFNWILRRFKKRYIHIVSMGFFLNIIALSTPLLTMFIYDRIISTSSLSQLMMFFIGGCFAVAMELVFRSLRTQSLAWFATRTDNIVSNEIFAQLLNLSPDMTEKASVSSQIARVKTFESVRDFYNSPAFLSLIEIIYVPLALITMYCLAGNLACIPLVMIGFYYALYQTFNNKIKAAMRLAARASTIRQQFVIDTFVKIKAIKVYGLANLWSNKFRELSGREQMYNFHLNWLGTMAETMAQTITSITIVCLVYFGSYHIWNNEMTTGALVASMILVWRILNPFYTLCTMIPRLEQIRNSVLQVNKLMDIENERQLNTKLASLSEIKGNVSFVNAGFRYEGNNEAIFSGLNLVVPMGNMVTIEGKNGCGKSTIFKIIKNLYTLNEGVLLIDGFDTRQLNMEDLRRHIAYVPQEPQFFDGTIRDNILLINPIATNEEIRLALSLADALDEIMDLPTGMETNMLHGSVTINKGLLTKLSLARAYLHDASILLIDELPNSVLSGKAGVNLKEFLGRVKGKKTVFFNTYRDDYKELAEMHVYLNRSESPVIEMKSIKSAVHNSKEVA